MGFLRIPLGLVPCDPKRSKISVKLSQDLRLATGRTVLPQMHAQKEGRGRAYINETGGDTWDIKSI
jgi:hypothetical protein